MSQTVAGEQAVARCLPSLETAIDRRLLRVTSSRRISLPLAASQKPTVPSALADSRISLFGVNASALIAPLCLHRSEPSRAMAPVGSGSPRLSIRGPGIKSSLVASPGFEASWLTETPIG